ncbi:MAG: oxygen-dependent coproporphyrinogen oxidase [Deinococcales bacterium]
MSRRERVVDVMRVGQAELIEGFETIDGQGRFQEHSWERPGGGGGTARVLEGGRVFERAGVNLSVVHGEHVPDSLARQHPAAAGKPFFATGVSMVLHPVNPYVPAFHANFRYFETGAEDDPDALWWFGGGADATPSYPFAEDAVHFHRSLQALCERHPDVADYPRWKAICDDYFTIRHRHEMRGIGGIFFDEISAPEEGDFDAELGFVRDGLGSLLESYLPVVERRMELPYGERERDWQLYRRGRYVEFNLVYDRGTVFGLQTQGNIEAILMSMPPLARWTFDHHPAPGSPEEAALGFFQPRDWVGAEAAALDAGGGA